MNKTKLMNKITLYTSGPWESKDQWGYIKIHSEGNGVCAIHGLGVNSQANARLIAAAPDLLDALDWALRQIEDDLDPDHQAAFETARSTLRKAKGDLK